ncbi:MAG: head GIN domain-containing protein [Bacteroidota bacterium]|nr:head GIN domain-containing protein [Bacteroidota bacterium]
MKAIITLFILWLIPLTVAAQEFILPAVSPFEEVKVAGNIHLELVVSDETHLKFEGEDEAEKLNISWSKGTLTLKTPTALKKTSAIKVKLYCTELTGLEITRGAVVQSADVVPARTLSLKADTGGKAEFAISSDSINARVHKGSDIILRGNTGSLSVVANSSGNFLGYELAAENTWVKANTGAQVKVNSSEYLNAYSTGGAFVGYMGNPEQTEFKSTLGGDIIQEKQ